MDPRLRLEIGKFNSAMRELGASLAGHATMEQVIDAEVGKILEAALAGTDAATVSSIRSSSESRLYITRGGKKYKLSNRYPNNLWRSISAQRKASLVRKLAARGLAKQSFLALAREVGVEVKAPGYVAAATTPRHSNADNVETRRDYKNEAYGIMVRDSSPLIRWTGARQAFFAAVAGRRNFYAQNLKHGVFKDLAKVAAKYPGLALRF